MYPKKINRTVHVARQIQRDDSVKSIIIDKLVQDYGKKNQLNVNLIMAYVDDFFVFYKATEGAVRALKEEIKDATLRPQNEKQLMIQRLHQRMSRKLKEEQLKTLTNPNCLAQLPEKSEEQNNFYKMQNKTQSNSKMQLMNTLPNDKFEERRKSIYQVDGGSVDEWAAIIKYDTLQFQKELEEQKRLMQLNQQKIKEELDRQVAEKELRKQKEKQEDQYFYATNQQQLMEFERQQELIKENKKQQFLQEKYIRDQQVQVDKKMKKEQNLNTKYLEEEMLTKIKEQMKAEDQQQKRKRLEQKEKFQQILKQNENLRKKAQDEIIQTKEHEKLLQEEQLIREQFEIQKKDKQKKDQENKFQQLMNNYSQFVMENKNDHPLQNDFWTKKNSEHSTFFEFKNKTNKKEQQLQVSYDLQQQIQEKKRRYTQEVTEKKLLFEQQIQEQKALKKQDEEKRNNIRQMYILNQEELKKQMAKGYLSQSPKKKSSPNERMVGQELLHNKKLLKKIANDNSIGITIKKQEISIPD
ncbi:unnamed protein product (macronuclear) [Paramecium tetraurelia]|uniref:Trichohyalin-plectin-homology domain-containing protein n=1 Tax=Paramecium tetraurelia TaxID=5888 RepID=A0D0G8_PARTE|nr:uncharacterized protein GSPATT00012087001 [Paramecium tetraurelia]CAK76535.1 unnamed protein product [Paramecium tetraurelia]|eukprot:XP_001443932.1 hypothetical protein (macronuclear) [Paramecium tetraurelia strain d4-2]